MSWLTLVIALPILTWMFSVAWRIEKDNFFLRAENYELRAEKKMLLKRYVTHCESCNGYWMMLCDGDHECRCSTEPENAK